MIGNKKVVIATLTGFVLGLSCWAGGVFLFGYEYSALQVTNILAHRTILGFVIGVTSLNMNWALRGILLGSVLGSLFILYDLLAGYPQWVALVLLGVNAFYGFVIELVVKKFATDSRVFTEERA